MNITPRPRFSLGRAACTLAFALGSTLIAPPTEAAGYHPTGQEQAAIAKLVADLQAIKAGSEITDAEKQALAADFTLLTTGTTKPSQASVDQLTEDLAAALADGSVSPADQAKLLLDLDAVFNTAGISTQDAQKIIADVQAILVSSGIDAADVKLVVGDLSAIAAGIKLNFIATNTTFPLASPANDPAVTGLTALSSTISDDGKETATLSVSTLGLITGTYSVNATTATGGSVVTTLGSLEVLGLKGKAGVGAVVFGDTFGHPFPSGFQPGELTTVTLTSASGAAQLSGGASAANKFTRLGNFRLVAGPAAPSALGNVAFKVKMKASGTKNQFLLNAWQLPANATLTLKANGSVVGTVQVNKKGFLLIQGGSVVLPVKADGITPVATPTPLPAGINLVTLEFLELDNAQGQVVAVAGFAP